MGYSKQSKVGLGLAVAFAAILGFNHSWAGSLTVTKDWISNETLNAADLNQNFTDAEDAVTDNDSRITTLETQAARAMFFGGDGSGGDVNITASTSWIDVVPTNPNYGNITIAAGQTLTLAAGTTIRCNGDFINNGTITIGTGAVTGIMYDLFDGTTSWGRPAHPGDTPSSAGWGESTNSFTTTPVTLSGGYGGRMIDMAMAASEFHNFKYGGGGGVGYWEGGNGGGLVKIYCTGAIENNGTINANGQTSGGGGVGGGGGGIVVLASMTSIDNSAGTINANGGVGGNNISSTGNGGGGGGGIVIFVAPIINSAGGTISVTGGAGGTGTTTVTNTSAIAGGGGGGSGGNGGSGGVISNTGAPGNGAAGVAGYTIEMGVNPASLVH